MGSRVYQKKRSFFNFAMTWHVGRMVHLGKKTDWLKVFRNPTTRSDLTVFTMGRDPKNKLKWHILGSTAARVVVHGLLDAKYRVSYLMLIHYVRLK